MQDNTNSSDDLEILIIGAGLSGINAAYRVKTELPQASFSILESRDVLGGTWSFWNYPGFRSDSAMTTFGFPWHPWTNDRKIVEGDIITRYIQDAVDAQGIERHIRYGHHMVSADWNFEQKKWHVKVAVQVKGEQGEARVTKLIKARWLLMCTGYYAYERALETQIPGIKSFNGAVVHPQWWPEDLDYADKRVAIIGSGATAWTLLPAMAKTASQITVVQRSPSYVFNIPSQSPTDRFLRRFLPLWLAHWIAWSKDLLVETALALWSLNYPGPSRRFFTAEAKKQLPEGYPVDVDFNPSYDPFEQRLGMTPDGELFQTLQQPNTKIVTDRIDTVTHDGIRTASGHFIPADIIVTATGLYVRVFGGATIKVDGKPIDIGKLYSWRGCMLEGVPNAAAVIGYTTGSWTPGADAVSRLIIKVIRHTRKVGSEVAMPFLTDKEKEGAPRDMAVDAKSNYFVQARDRMPMSMGRGVWYGRKNVIVDWIAILFGNMNEGLVFDTSKGADSKKKV